MKHLEFHRVLLPEAIKFRGKPDPSDEVDKEVGEEEEVKEVYTIGAPLFTILSMTTYVTDVVSSISVCYLLSSEDPLWWFIMTFVPLIISLVTVNGFSIRWYIHDYQEGISPAVEISKTHWALRWMFHVVLLGPVVRYMELLLYGIHSREVLNPLRKDYQVLVLQEERDTSLLALVGSFIKSAPQLVLQIYILTKKDAGIELMTRRAQITSVAVSLVELAMSLTIYHRALRRSHPNKMEMTKTGCAMQFISHCCIIGSRVFTLAAFASIYPEWLLLMCLLHWASMTSWLIFQRTTFCDTASGDRRVCEEILFNFVVGIIYVFCFLNVKDEPTRWKYTFYYSTVLGENLALVTLWYVTSPHVWYNLHLLLGSVCSFAIGILTLIIYYQFLHPNKVNRISNFVILPYPGS